MEVDFVKINQVKVRKYMLKHGLDKLSGFAKIKALCYEDAEETTYRTHFQTYLIKNNLKSVWRTYKTIHPKEAWNGEMVSFGLQYSKCTNRVNYLDDLYAGMEPGQIIILNLRLLWGLLNIAVAHEVAEVNEQEYLIKLCYMEGGASEGSQWIQLHETREGHTEVKHLTRYKSKSSFRDTVLYPRLHTKAITEFHRNVKKKAELLTS